MGSDSFDTVIVGAGIHGISVALALASRGRKSLVLEASDSPFAGASVKNEGKIHLGFVYALDRTGETTRAMVEGSLAFAPLIDDWCDGFDWAAARSQQFAYVVMNEGLAGPELIGSHYDRVLERLRESAAKFGSNYLGVDLRDAAVRRHDEVLPGMVAGHSGCWFETPERAIDPRILAAKMVETANHEPLIEIRTGHRVTGARRKDPGFGLRVETASGPLEIEAETVVNCAWEERPRLDNMVLEDRWEGAFRVKHHVVLRGGDLAGLRSSTLVQGPFGDVVIWPNGDVYISWYPDARTHFGDRPERSLRSDRSVAETVHEAMVEMFPPLAGFDLVSFAPCHILARGRTDIDDPSSDLHRRAGAEFVESGGWWSLRSSKLTTGPLAGERCAAALTDTGARY